MYKQEIEAYINKEIEVIKLLDTSSINDVMTAIVEAYNNDGSIYIFGNGGSASTASHFQNDFNKGVSEKLGKKFNFICLNDNVPTVMAIANDSGYENVFEYQLHGRLKKNDLVIAISGSGNSENVLRAIKYAKEQSIKTIGITGFDGGKLARMVDISFNVPIDDMQITEDVHMILDHLMMSVLMKKL
ncbi:MAG: SIS domain-containing protein [Oscillospiraceae bacterium]|nr:SIS domain-containing protein [Oscillospiraceae bacterium]